MIDVEEYFEVFPWNENLSTGIDTIDNQHKIIIHLLNKLASNLINDDDVVIEEIFDELTEYAHYHFSEEVRIWGKYLSQDEWLSKHISAHSSFLPQILELQATQKSLPYRVVVENIVKFLIHWLAYHILDDDKKLALIVERMDSGMPLAEAKRQAQEDMGGAMHTLINTILSMYDGLSTRTFEVLRERRERIKAEKSLQDAYDDLEKKVQERTADLRKEISDRIQAEDELNKILQAIDHSPLSIVITDLTGEIQYTNKRYSELTGYDPKDSSPRNPNFIKTAHEFPQRHSEMWASLKKGAIWRGEIQELKKDGMLHWESVTIIPTRDRKGDITRYFCLEEDISLKKEYEDQLFKSANFNTLTGLPNRANITNQLEIASGQDKAFTLVYVELIGIGKINQSLGIEAGDYIIKQASQRLSNLASAKVLLAHMGGNEFLFYITDTAQSSAEILISGIHAQFNTAIPIDETEIFLTCGIGVALFPTDGTSPRELLKNAHAATERSKAKGQNAYTFFSPKLNESASKHLLMEAELRHAIEQDELLLYLQPKVNAITGSCMGAEALLRWNSSKLGFVSPAEFIPVAERTDLIIPIGNWVIDATCAEISQLNALGYDDLLIALNASPKQFTAGNIVEYLESSIERHGIRYDQIEVEITEGLLMNSTQMIEIQIEALKNIGVRIALDDFGTGYSSFSYLQKFPFDTLKIDQSFVRNLEHAPRQRDLIKAMVSIGKAFGMKIVAEGVEEEGQRQYLRDKECHIFQGYLFAKPMPVADFIRWLGDGNYQKE